MARINKQLQREISLLLEQRVKNEVAKSAIVTGVECARDLEFARVYFTTLDSATRESVLTELQNVRGAMRSMLGQILKLRHIPALEFVIDRSLDYGEHIDKLLNKLGLDDVKSDKSEQEFFEDEDEDENENEDTDEENDDGGSGF
jgi:ribosome-binding factor A